MFLIIFLFLLLIFGYFYVNRAYEFWARQNVPFVEPKFPFGNINGLKPVKHSCLVMDDHYNKLKGRGPFGGLYIFTKPVVFVTDLEMIKNVLVKDFQYFINRGLYFNEKDDPLSAHLFSIEGQKWRDARMKLTPTFTSGKMKLMFPIITGVGEEFRKCVANEMEKDSVIELKEILSRFTTDVIGTCAFGIECNSLKDPNAKFREMGRQIFGSPKYPRVVQSLIGNFPKISRKLHLTITNEIVSKFFLGVVEETIEYRKTNNIQRHDFMDLLIELQKSDKNENGLTLGEIGAHAFVFFLAGFETSSTAMSYSLYELALNHEIQEKARKEVNDVLKKHNGKFSYEAMMDMKYIEQCINESLRKYPPAPMLIRTATTDYEEPISGITIKKNTQVLIPTYSIHHDNEIYPDPEIYNPDRFSDDEVKNRNQYSFLPFGEGPRNCIGLRFGMMQARIGLAVLLLNFKFSTCSKSVVPIKFEPQAFLLQSAGGLWLKLEKCNFDST